MDWIIGLADRAAIRIAMARAERIEEGWMAADLIEVIYSLEAFWNADYPDEVVRSSFVEPFFLAVLDETIRVVDPTSDSAVVLRELILGVANEEQLDRASMGASARVLATAIGSGLLSPDEIGELERLTEYYSLGNEVAQLLGLGADPALDRVDTIVEVEYEGRHLGHTGEENLD